MQTHFDVTPEERATALSFFKRQLFRQTHLVTQSEIDLTGQIAIVTGSNTGLGLECSRQLLELGLGKLIIAVRSITKGETARQQLLSERSIENQTIEVWELDLSDYDSITQFIERAKTLPRLEIVVHSAGISNKIFRLNEKTLFDEVIQTNYLSMVLLTVLLLPVLQDKNSPGQPGRLVLVSSDTAAWAEFKEKSSRPLLPAFSNSETFDGTDR
ncbi:short-chain dehydrogenase reductase [Colletotrichum truncatum]|uniref:Short-chain dehydrogenase reductase n=1 Tax=Colletotrichum truncatum TaxID=5467 RepID=A0ACC3Z8S1_COLTU|nr:short-chain dehydrogenase reductase [Colletotrichum truncatum]KAF6789283.1 short-chain dehydrogenase reductase [Colletotrichum truncatum]